jgi:hypothetical protein
MEGRSHMIARVGYFEGLTAEQKAAQEDNGKRRLKPFLTTQPGLVAAIYLETPKGDRISFSIWETERSMAEAGARMNSTPLLEGQLGSDIPSPERVEIWQVRDYYASESTPVPR